MHSVYLDSIKQFEGFNARAYSDYAQISNGYGTKALYPGEVIDRVEADRRFQAEIGHARKIVENAAPHVDEGTKAALTSLTYNAGTAWIKSGLGDAVRRGDLAEAKDIFTQYNKAGGEVLPGLVRRRAVEVEWIGNPAAITQQGSNVAPALQTAALTGSTDVAGATARVSDVAHSVASGPPVSLRSLAASEVPRSLGPTSMLSGEIEAGPVQKADASAQADAEQFLLRLLDRDPASDIRTRALNAAIAAEAGGSRTAVSQVGPEAATAVAREILSRLSYDQDFSNYARIAALEAGVGMRGGDEANGDPPTRA